MHSTTALVLALHAITALAAPPARRDEWQPTTSTTSYIEGDPPIPAPTAHPNTDWQPEGNQTCMYITSNYEWTGYGLNLCNPAGACANKLPDGLSGQVLSVGPSSGQVCFLYSGQYCTGLTSDPIVHPGHSNLNDMNFGNLAQSWKCFKMVPPEDPAASSSSSASTTAATSSAPSKISSTSILPSSMITSSPSMSISTMLTTTIATVTEFAPISISTTSSHAVSDPQTTPGGIPISRTMSASQPSSSMSISTMTVTVLSVSSTSTTSISSAPSTSTIVVVPMPAPFTFNPISSTMVTHTFANGAVTTTYL